MTGRDAVGGPPAGEGRADLHIHTLASDGTAGIEAILEQAELVARLDVIAITDHERIDAALAARAMAIARGYRVQVVVGEEISTRGGHLLGLWLREPIRPWRSLRESIAEIHEQGGLAIPAHPLFPYPLCAQGPFLERLLADRDPRVRPDGLETFNPTTFGRPVHRRVVGFVEAHGLAGIGCSDAHALDAVGQGWTSFAGSSASELRDAIHERRTGWHGSFHHTIGQLSTFGLQLRKRGRDLRDDTRARILGAGNGRDLGIPAAYDDDSENGPTEARR
jgi:predicted metal-dependent phosphoesterase TrpH